MEAKKLAEVVNKNADVLKTSGSLEPCDVSLHARITEEETYFWYAKVFFNVNQSRAVASSDPVVALIKLRTVFEEYCGSIMEANDCIILGIDSGKESGWGIIHKEQYIDSGVALTHVDRSYAYDLAREAAVTRGKPLVIGRETWHPGWKRDERSFKVIIGLGASWGRWEDVLEEKGFPKSRIFSVTDDEWRSSVLSLRRGRYNREQAKTTAINSCVARRWLHGDELPNHNEAEGLLVAYYFVYNSKVAQAIRNPRRLKGLPSK
jgi:hypothetical protein